MVHRRDIRPPLTGRVQRLGGSPSIGVDSEVKTKGDMFAEMRFALQIQRLFANLETVRNIEAAQDGEAAEFAREQPQHDRHRRVPDQRAIVQDP